MMRRIMRRLTAFRDDRDHDRGSALITTIIVGMVLLALVATATTVALSGMRKSGNDADWNAAMSAAYAGVEDYQSRLSNDNTYVKYGDPAAPFTVASGSTGTVMLPSEPNLAFGVGTGGTWATVPNSGGVAKYRYEVDNSRYSVAGAVRLRATGMVGDSVRSLVVNVKQEGFLDFLYFTDYELVDPVQESESRCTPHYAWSKSSNTHSGCTSIQFAAADAFNGPVHSNDTLRICGSTFNGEVTTSNSRSPYYLMPSGCSAPVFSVPGFPKYSMTVKMPQSNQELRKEYRSDLASSTVPRPGCLYTGPTVITFLQNGTMNVKSPFTKRTRISNEAATAGSRDPECGMPGPDPGGLGSPEGATIDVLEQNLVFVQNVPSSETDVNYTAPGAWPDNFSCTNAADSTPWGWTFGTQPNPAGNSTSTFIRFPIIDELPRYASPHHYGCRTGDAYVSGKVDGAMTVATENYIYVTGNLQYVDESADVLGLIGQNAIWVWNPVSSAGVNLLPAEDRIIDAAILSVAHTFAVQNYNLGAYRGKLVVTGAIAQKFRGTVATASGGSSIATGYAKEYSYDHRLRYMAPPKFLSPVSTTYGVSEIVEVKTAYKPDGSTAS
jgi:hypothetical protein